MDWVVVTITLTHPDFSQIWNRISIEKYAFDRGERNDFEGRRARGSATGDVLRVETQGGGVSTGKVQEKQLHGIIETVEVLRLPPLEQQWRQGHFRLPNSSLQHEEKSWKGSPLRRQKT